MVRKLAFLALVLSPSIAFAQQTRTQPPASFDFQRSASLVSQPEYLREPANPVQRAARAFGTCVRTAYGALPAGMSAEAATASLMQSCDAPFQAVATAASQAIADAHWADSRKDRARAALRARLDLVPQRVAASVRAGRPVNAAVFAR